MSIKAGTLVIAAGKKFTATLTFWLDYPTNSIPRDLSDKSLLMQIKPALNSAAVKELKTTPTSGDGRLTVSGTGHNIVTIALEDNDSDLELGEYTWDMMIVTTDGNDEYITPINLPLQVVQGTSEPI